MIYLDNAASTEPTAEVLDALRTAAAELYSNPASAHAGGAAAARALAQARGEVAAALDVEPGELVFTSGGTEADALGVLGAARAARGRHLVVSGLEHPAVMRCAEALAGEGWALDVVAPDAHGVVSADAVAAAVRPDTAVVALMLVNNELGTRQPVADLARRLGPPGDRKRPHLHVDAVQGFGLARLRPRALGADSVAVSAHKLHGPRGAGALWLRPGARVAPAVGRRRAGARPPRRQREPAGDCRLRRAPRGRRATPSRPASRNASPPCAIASSKRRSARWPPTSRACARRSRGCRARRTSRRSPSRACPPSRCCTPSRRAACSRRPGRRARRAPPDPARR